jgi:CheY-specific phosphatase CheX
MNNTQILSTLKSTAAAVLENAAFLFVDDDPVDIREHSYIGGAIKFKGVSTGNVQLWVTKEVADSIARNMLGYDDYDIVSEQKRVDALKEMLNMVTGNLLIDLYGDDDVFELEIPELLESCNVSRMPEFAVVISAESIPVMVGMDLVAK